MGQRSDARLGEARALVAQGEQRRALDSLERTREAALAEKRLDVLEEALELAVELRDRTRGRLRFAYGSLAHSTVQNIRFLTRQQALERGEPWVDPAPAAQAAPGPPAPARSPIESEGASTSPSHELVSRLERLEEEVAGLRAELAAVRAASAERRSVAAPSPETPPVAAEPPPAGPTLPPLPAAPEPGPAPAARPVPEAAVAPARRAERRPAPPPKPPRRTLGELAREWDLVGARGVAIAGGSVMALGIALFFVLAADRGWIDAQTRVLLGAAASTLALGAGVVLRARYGQYWSALAAVGAGIAGEYATLAAATARYDLVPDALALPLAAVVAAAGTVIAVRWRSQTIAAIGLLGAALAPALQSLDTEVSWTSAAFAVIVLVAAGAVSVPRGWRELLLVASAVVGVQLQWLVSEAGSSPGAGTVVVAAAFALTLVGIAVGLQLVREERGLDELGLGYATAAFAVTLVWTILLFGDRVDRGVALLASAGAWALVSAGLLRLREPDLVAAVGAFALALAAVGTADLLSDAALTVAWAAEALVLAYLARRLGDARLQAAGFLYVALATASAFATDARPSVLFDDAADQLAAVLPLAASAAAAVGAALLAPSAYRPRTESGLLSFVRDLRIGLERHRSGDRQALVFAGGTLGTLAAVFLAVSVSFGWGHVLASLLAAAAGATFLAAAARLRSENLAIASYVWLAVVLIEATAFDLPQFSDPDVNVSKGGAAVIAASAGLLVGAYAHRVEDPGRRLEDVLFGVCAGVAALFALVGVRSVFQSPHPAGAALLGVSIVYLGLAGIVFGRESYRNAATTLWSFGLFFLVSSESALVSDSVARAVTIAATALAIGALAGRLAESRLWLAGGSLLLVTSGAVLLGLVQPWRGEGELELRVALASAACALAAFGLAALVWRDDGRRDLRTVVWATGLVLLLATERVVFDDWRVTGFAVALTGGLLAFAARPLGEPRVWVAAGIVVALTTWATIALVTPPSHFFVASSSPGSGLWVLMGCVVGASLVAVTAPRPPDRVVLAVVGGGLALYAVSLGILGIAVRVSGASVATDFERGHTAVSALWALIGLALLVSGLLRGSALLRYGGLGLFGVSLAKIFLYDLSELSSVARAFSFILVGGLLLAGGFFLQRLSDRMGPRATPHT